MALLEQDGIEYEIIPGISSALAAAAELKIEYTIPGSTQTIIFTRMEGKTNVPKEEDLAKLASHKSSLVIFLSSHLVKKVQEKLLEHYNNETPIAIAYRVGWPDSKIIKTTLKNLPDEMEKNDIKRHALILIGPSISVQKNTEIRSYLYGSHKNRSTND